MTRRLSVVSVLLVLAASLIAVAAVSSGSAQDAQPLAAQQDTLEPYEAPVDVDTNNLRGPRQPVFFRHDVHAGQYEMDCQYCHVNLEISTKPGIPTMASCMNCHQIVGTGNAEVQKLREAFAEGRPIEWVEVHALSQFVHFPHMRHVNSTVMEELECETCHGQVDREPQIYQYASLKMGWCLDCHIEQDVSRDCSVCHY